MRKSTLNLLQRYAEVSASSDVPGAVAAFLDRIKLWWKSLSVPEKAEARRMIEAELSKRKFS